MILRVLSAVVPHGKEGVEGPGKGGEGPEVTEVVGADSRAGETRGVELWRTCAVNAVVFRANGVAPRAIIRT